jgi:hypothetical protein
MKRRRRYAGTPPGIILILTVLLSLFYATPSLADEIREIQIGNLDYVISVPAEWERSYLEGTMKLHFKMLPTVEVQGRFTVYAQDRGAVGFEDWVQYHREKNLPLMYGNFLINSEREARAGACRAWIFQMLDLEGRAGYGSYETLIVTEHHAVMINLLYDLYQAGKAWEDLENILASFTSDPETVKRARLSFDEGRTLGLEGSGLFLRLPEGWFPEKFSSSCDYVRIRLPSNGYMEVASSRRLPKGICGLENFLERKISDLEDLDGATPATLGLDAAEAFRLESPAMEKALPMILFYGLNGKGGYGMALHSKDRDEFKLFHKVAARAVLMDPSEAKKMRAAALASFKKAVKEKDVQAVRQALRTLELFSGCGKTAKELGSGFKSVEKIQVACAISLGRMASKTASQILQRSLENDLVSEPAKKACIKAMAMIGTSREQQKLEKLQEKPPKDFSVELKDTLDQSLKNFTCLR